MAAWYYFQFNTFLGKTMNFIYPCFFGFLIFADHYCHQMVCPCVFICLFFIWNSKFSPNPTLRDDTIISIANHKACNGFLFKRHLIFTLYNYQKLSHASWFKFFIWNCFSGNTVIVSKRNVMIKMKSNK
jgi:hypothetical protein